MPRRTPPCLRPPTTTTRPRPLRDRGTSGTAISGPCPSTWMAKGVYELQLAAMHEHPRLFCDETPMPVLDPGRGRTRTCQFWAHATDDRSWKGPAPPAVAYVFAGGRGKKEILTQLTGFEGVLQVDGYAAYASLAGDKKTSGKIRLAFCL